jgi:hypothetical protein
MDMLLEKWWGMARQVENYAMWKQGRQRSGPPPCESPGDWFKVHILYDDGYPGNPVGICGNVGQVVGGVGFSFS